MGDAIWNSISQSFKDGLLELLVLHLVKNGPAETAKKEELVQRIAKQTGLWFSEGKIAGVLRHLENRCMLQRVPNSYIFGITPHGKEEIEDRISTMERFIGYIKEVAP